MDLSPVWPATRLLDDLAGLQTAAPPLPNIPTDLCVELLLPDTFDSLRIPPNLRPPLTLPNPPDTATPFARPSIKMQRILLSLSLLASAAVGALASDDLKIDVTLPVECERKTQKGDTINVHYRGTLQSNGQQFDASESAPHRSPCHVPLAPLPLPPSGYPSNTGVE